MKGNGKPRLKSIKQFLGIMLASMGAASNPKTVTDQKKIFDMQMPELFTGGRTSRRHKHNTRSRKASPGWKRKMGVHAKMKAPKPNPDRRARKPLYGGWPHMLHKRGAFMGDVPTQDQVRALEQRIGLKVKVKHGKCHVGDSGLVLPHDCTLDQAIAALDEHLDQKAYAAWLKQHNYEECQPEGA